jgi:hypothetical protein
MFEAYIEVNTLRPAAGKNRRTNRGIARNSASETPDNAE